MQVDYQAVVIGTWWAENRYQAYEGITVPKFPNYFVISFGPRSASGSSWFSIIEAHSTHAIRAILAKRPRWVEWSPRDPSSPDSEERCECGERKP